MRSKRVYHSSFDDDENSDDDDDENDETQTKRQNEDETIFETNKNVVENESFESFEKKKVESTNVSKDDVVESNDNEMKNEEKSK
jgi:hypothetical protein